MKQEKTILEWLNQLPEPYKSQAIENTKNDNPFSWNEIVDSLWKAIDVGFLWSSTSQGGDYWFDIKARAANGEFNTPDDTIPWPPESDWSFNYWSFNCWCFNYRSIYWSFNWSLHRNIYRFYWSFYRSFYWSFYRSIH